MKLYGIPNCNTVKSARVWLDEHGCDYVFHDYKKHGVPELNLDRWLDALGWETLLNRRGTTWRGLDEAERSSVSDRDSARPLLMKYPSLIKRPILETGERVLAGFDAAAYRDAIR